LELPPCPNTYRRWLEKKGRDLVTENLNSFKVALVIGAGTGISASLARLFARNGIKVGLVSRNAAKLDALATESSAQTFTADSADAQAMAALFSQVDERLGAPDIVVYNASARAHGPVAEIDPRDVERALAVTAYGGFLAVHHAAKRMAPKGRGAILLTGASASIKGYPHSAAFAMGKFALRGLAQSAARELGPKGIHVAHFLIDGGVRKGRDREAGDTTLTADAIAQSYWSVLQQPPDAWTLEMDLRPWAEKF
jgi:NAD(P)-dependent dehydrogenase (short-subunit alcohol dehydrogenase family)